MSFSVGADVYWRFIGRYSEKLAVKLADFASVQAGQLALDVGCGPGALTAVLVERLGTGNVRAVDPSTPFVEVARTRLPGVDIREASAEDLPFESDVFDAAIAELVVHFMSDPVGGISEMARVTKTGGTVAACVWDYGGDTGALSPFWKVARAFEPGIDDESGLPGVREGHLAELFELAGLRDIRSSTLTVEVGFSGFDEWWEPFTLGVGPAGTYVAGLSHDTRERLRAACRAAMPQEAFTVSGSAWAAAGTV